MFTQDTHSWTTMPAVLLTTVLDLTTAPTVFSTSMPMTFLHGKQQNSSSSSSSSSSRSRHSAAAVACTRIAYASLTSSGIRQVDNPARHKLQQQQQNEQHNETPSGTAFG
jgi:hypothetical protein